MVASGLWRLVARRQGAKSTIIRPLTSTKMSSSTASIHWKQGSSIGTDKEMIAANHRLLPKNSVVTGLSQHQSTLLSNLSTSTSQSQRLYSTTTTISQAQAMKDEYGAMDDSGHTYIYDGAFALENGAVLRDAQLRYQTYGSLNADRSNVVVVCHALTGNASLHAWWGDLLGPGRAFDTDRYFIVCSNILGSCYGSTGPASINRATGKVYGPDFPDVSVKDTVRLQLLMLQNDLEVNSIQAVIGGSFGGMQAMEYAAQAGSSTYGDFFSKDGAPLLRSVVPIACGAAHTAWQIGVSEVQRQAIYKDPHWASGRPDQATAGLEVARQIGMISYRTPLGYEGKFSRAKQTAESPAYGSAAHWKVKSYLEYQGVKFLDRFDPVTYVKMTEQMDSHDLARGRAETTDLVLKEIQIPALIMGIDSDVLYPLYEQEHLAKHMPNGELKVIRSDDGHDGFLLEQDQVGQHITNFLAKFDS